MDIQQLVLRHDVARVQSTGEYLKPLIDSMFLGMGFVEVKIQATESGVITSISISRVTPKPCDGEEDTLP